MKSFWRLLLRKSLPNTSLSDMHHAIFGLGDSGYQQYNTVAKKLERRLQALGSPALTALGLGDDQHFSGYDSALDPWLQLLWEALSSFLPQSFQPVTPGTLGQPCQMLAQVCQGVFTGLQMPIINKSEICRMMHASTPDPQGQTQACCSV